MKDWNINRRVLVLALLPGVVLGLLLATYFTSLQLNRLDQSLKERGHTIVLQLAPASEYGVVSGNTEILERLASALLQESDVLGVDIRDVQGHTILSSGAVADEGSAPVPIVAQDGVCASAADAITFCAPIRQTRLRISDFVEQGDNAVTQRSVGWVFVSLSTVANRAQRGELIVKTLTITGVLLVFTSLFALYIGYQISHPIIVMTDAVRQVSRGNLDIEATTGSGGEIRTLRDGINTMIVSLRSARGEMQGRVDAATQRLRETLSELEQKNHDLEIQRQKAQQASEAKGQFLANMSHEIRTPLSGIIGMLALLERTDLQATQRSYVTNLTLAAKGLHSLLNDILDLSRIEAGKLKLAELPFSPAQVLDEVALMLAPSAHDKGLDLVSHPAATLPAQVIGDSLRLRQVLINLVSNAVKFTEQGTVMVRAAPTAGGGAQGAVVRFEVTDTGIGIAEDKQQSIFESFNQLDSSTAKRYGGSGLGTTIAKELVQLMGGTIGVQSKPGQGSTFWFELPWRMTSLATDKGPANGLSGQTVMIVQAPGEGRDAVVEIATQLGMRVSTESTMASALPAITSAPTPPILLLVEEQREAQWLTFASAVRRLPRRQQPVMFHATFFNGSTEPGLFDGHINKPMTLETLRTALLDVVVPSTTSPATAVVPQARPRKVLVAEDNQINALVIRSFLEQAGHKVVVAADGVEALTRLGQGGFDIAFVDMRMPTMDGLEATRQWRNREPEGQRLPIVALTANATVEDREQCLAAGMDAFLSKPVELGQLLAVLEQHCQKS